MQAFPKRKLVIGSTVVAVAALAGGAVAATQGSSNPRQQYLNDVAKRLNVTPAQLKSALNGAALDQLNAAVKAGKLTQAQANALKQRIQQGAAGGFPFIGPPGPGGPGGPGSPGHGPLGFGLGRAVFFGPDAPAVAVAKYLGLTEAQLLKQLQSGKSLADIAKAQGKTTSGLEQAITAAAKTRLDKAVANKRLTAAQEQKILSGLSARMNDLVNNTQFKGARPGLGFVRPAFGLGPLAETTAAAKYLGLTRAQPAHTAPERQDAGADRQGPRQVDLRARAGDHRFGEGAPGQGGRQQAHHFGPGAEAAQGPVDRHRRHGQHPRAEGSALRRTRTRVSEGFQGPLPAARELYPRSACARSARGGSACACRPVRLSSGRFQRLQTYAALIELSRVSDRRLLYWGSIHMRYESFRSNVQ